MIFWHLVQTPLSALRWPCDPRKHHLFLPTLNIKYLSLHLRLSILSALTILCLKFLSISLSLSLFQRKIRLWEYHALCAPHSHPTHPYGYCVWSHQILSKMTEFRGIWDEYYVMSKYPTTVNFNLGTRRCQATVTMAHAFRSWHMMTTWLNCTSSENVIFL